MKRINRLIIVILLLIVTFGVFSCTRTYETIYDSMVQVWIADTMESVGVAIGDGSYVLTVINYEEYDPGEVYIVVPGQGKYKASIQAIDSRTGATLLKLDGIKLSPATTGDTTIIKDDLKIIIHGWAGKEMILKSTPLLVSNRPDLLPLGFNVRLPDEELKAGGWVSGQGCVVTNKAGRVIGLESIFAYRLVIRLGSPGYIPPIISINSMLELLSPDVDQKPWANGPLLFFVTGRDPRSGGYDGFVNNYEAVTNEIKALLNRLGQPLTTDDVPPDFLKYAWPTQSPDGTMLTVTFPRPVTLQDTQGNVVAQAKWVGIQWDRSENKPNRIIYGDKAYNVSGSFEMLGGTTNLANIIREQLNHPYVP